MAIALLAALYHQRRTGEGQWVDMACIEAGVALNGPAVLDCTVNGRAERADGCGALEPQHRRRRWRRTASTRAATTTRGWRSPAATTTTGARWPASSASRGPRTPALRRAGRPPRRPGRARRSAGGVDRASAGATRSWPRVRAGRRARARRCARPPGALRRRRRRPGVGAVARRSPHTKHGAVRVDGLPVHLSGTDWRIERGGPMLGEDNERVLRRGARAVARPRSAGCRGRRHLMGPLDGVRVVELSHEHGAWAGKLLADLGADVIVVEPPGGSAAAPVRAVPGRRRPGPSAASGGGTTTRPSAASWPISTADRDRLLALIAGADVLHRGRGARRARRRRASTGRRCRPPTPGW